MKNGLRKFLFWTPRIAGILFVVFISIFALDVFDSSQGFLGVLIALFMHLIPSMVLAAAVVLAWRREWVGAVLFWGFAAWYLLSFRGFEPGVYLLLAGIPILIGLLFLTGWIFRVQIHGR